MDNRERRFELGKRVIQLKGLLHNSDYQAIKFAEGELSEDEYTPIREQRKVWRSEINELQAEIAELFTDGSNN